LATSKVASGTSVLDVTNLVASLMQVEQQPLTKLDSRIASVNTRISALGSFMSKATDFQSALRALGTASTFASRTVTSSDASVAAGAIRGVHGLAETQLQSTQVRYEDLVAACDAVISKPGFGIIGECATAGVPLLYTSRGAFREYDVLVDEMPRILRCRFIGHPDLFAGRWRDALNALVAQPAPPEHWPANGADVATQHITRFL